MFTGIVENTGKIVQIKPQKDYTSFTVETDLTLKGKKSGQSIAINGVCTTITQISKNAFSFDAIPETLSRTNLGEAKKGDSVNIEFPLTLNQNLDGHLVQGHVDTMGTVKDFKKNQLTLNFPEEISKFLAFKGSISINGVSLTISDLQEDNFTVDLIPLTLKKTNLGNLKKGDKVNLEIDIIARYLDRLMQDKAQQATYEFLKERGLI